MGVQKFWEVQILGDSKKNWGNFWIVKFYEVKFFGLINFSGGHIFGNQNIWGSKFWMFKIRRCEKKLTIWPKNNKKINLLDIS